MTLLVRAGRLVDVVAGEVLTDRTIVIEGDRVASVLAAGAPTPPADDLVDLSDSIVLPGLVDLHTHLVGPREQGDTQAYVRSTMASDALWGAANAGAMLRAGVTTVRDVGTFRAFVDIALRDAIDAGTVPGPRMRCAGAYITRTGGGGEVTGLPGGALPPAEMRVGVADTPEEVREAAKRILAAGADLLKVIATGAVLAPGTEPGEPEMTEVQLRAAVEVAADGGAYVAAHAHGAEGAKRAIRAGVRSVEHGSLLDDEALDLMGERGTWLVADVYNGDWIAQVGLEEGWPADTLRKNTETTESQRAVFAEAVRRGVSVAFGTDAGVYPHELAARQLPVMVSLGLDPVRTLRAATYDAARCLGWEDEVGSLQPGRYADLVAVPGHDLGDLSDLQHPRLVLKGGQSVNLH